MNTPPPLTQIEFSEKDMEFAKRIAKRQGYTQTVYTSTSELWGLFCLSDNPRHKAGCVIKTREFGFLFVSDLEDLKFHDLHEEQIENQKEINEKSKLR